MTIQPAPMTDEQIYTIASDLSISDFAWQSDTPEFAQAIIAARDAQWAEMLKGQEPVAWRYKGKLHEFDPSDWASPEFAITPLYTHPAPDHTALLRQALEALQDHSTALRGHEQPYVECITAIKEALK
jgi:hypothetical protein